MSDYIECLPPYYRGSAEMCAIQQAFQTVGRGLSSAVAEYALQLNPNTATWGLAVWEEALGLPVDLLKDLEERRFRVISKLRGSGATTVSLIRSVAESYAGCEVDVIEDFENYTVVIDFVGTKGLPPNMDDITASFLEIMPAHLSWSYKYNYSKNSELNPYTHGELGAFTHEQLRTEDL